MKIFSIKKMSLKMSSAKWCPFCIGLNELTDGNPLLLKHGLTLIPISWIWMINYIHYKMWDEITYPFQKSISHFGNGREILIYKKNIIIGMIRLGCHHVTNVTIVTRWRGGELLQIPAIYETHCLLVMPYCNTDPVGEPTKIVANVITFDI